MGKFTSSYIFPHPPVIVPEIGQGQEKTAIVTINAIKVAAENIKNDAPTTIIMTSPHAPYFENYIYISDADVLSGNFAKFGAKSIELKFENNLELAKSIISHAKDQGISCGGIDKYGPKNNKIVYGLDHGALVPLYFIAKQYKNFKLVWISITDLSNTEHYNFGKCIGQAVLESNENVVFIASGDLSHKLTKDAPYGYSEYGKEFDDLIVNSIKNQSYGYLNQIDETLCENAAQCGLKSFITMFGALDGYGIKSNLYSYEGPYGVGYMVAKFDIDSSNINSNITINKNIDNKEVEDSNKINKQHDIKSSSINTNNISASRADNSSMNNSNINGSRVDINSKATNSNSNSNSNITEYIKINDNSKKKIERTRTREDEYVALARKAIEAYINDGWVLKVPKDISKEILRLKAGVFVSIKKRGNLRGCIGTIFPFRSNVAEEIINNAISAAANDPRFEPVRPDELDSLAYSVDILTQPHEIRTVEELDVKRFGIIVRCGRRAGVLLPDIEGIDTVKDQVTCALKKAGIDFDEDFTIEKFEVERHF